MAAALLLPMALTPSASEGQVKAGDPPRKILVELYTSQGCKSCPPASDLLGRLAKLGYGPDRVVALNFHVDSSNEPWVDPYSDPSSGRRRAFHGEVLRRRDLSFTPLMIIDGRDPLVGSDRSAALAALGRADRGGAKVSLALALSGAGPRKSLSVKLASRSPAVARRELLVGVALAEDPVTTRVRSGENAGRTLVEHQVVRQFIQEPTTLDGSRPRNLTFPVELADGRDAGRFRVSVFVQDRLDGTVYQAESIPWGPAEQARVVEKRKRWHPKGRHLDTPNFTILTPSVGSQGHSDDDTSCPDCGTPFSPEYLITLPPGYNRGTRHLFPQVPPPMC